MYMPIKNESIVLISTLITIWLFFTNLKELLIILNGLSVKLSLPQLCCFKENNETGQQILR